jgi:hypothetical protein
LSAVIGLGVVGVLVSACSSAGAPAAAVTAGPSSPRPAASPTATPTPYTGDLRLLLLPPPATSHPFGDPASKSGTLNADQIAAGFAQPDKAKMQLLNRDFVIGAIEHWSNDADDTQVEIRLYEFPDSDLARSWYILNHTSYQGSPDFTDQSPVDGIDPSGFYVSIRANSDNFVRTVGVAWRDNIYLQVTVFQPGRAIRSPAETVVKSQYARLP